MPRDVIDSFSVRSREVAEAAERFRAKWGRAPQRGELRALKLENRKVKVLISRTDLQRAWEETATRHDFDGHRSSQRVDRPPEVALEARVEQRLTKRVVIFEAGELRAVLLEQSVGKLAPQDALAVSKRMIAEDELEGQPNLPHEPLRVAGAGGGASGRAHADGARSNPCFG